LRLFAVAAILIRMSHDNVEVVRRAIDGFNERGLPALLELADPEIEWTTTGRYVEAGTYHGHEGIRRYLGAVLGEFDDARTDADEYIDAGDDVVVPSRFSGRGKRSGAQVELAMTIVYTVRDGRIVRARNFEDRTEALRAAGLVEQAGE
jgi:ketosteroid isomerase-like protein